MEPTEITAGRLHLRPWQAWDAPAVHAACQDPEIQRWTTVPVPYAEADARAWVEEVTRAGWEQGTTASFAVLDAVDARLLASVALMRIADGAAEIGYWCAPGERGRGVVTEAVGAVCRWGFGVLELDRVTWLAEVGNTASRRVADGAGFRFEGTLRAWLPARGGGKVDAWIGGLLPGDR